MFETVVPETVAPRSRKLFYETLPLSLALHAVAIGVVIVAGVFRSSLPDSERLSTDQLIADLTSRGQRARSIDTVDDIVSVIAAEHRAGDLVVLMSNGGFGGIHHKLLRALAA